MGRKKNQNKTKPNPPNPPPPPAPKSAPKVRAPRRKPAEPKRLTENFETSLARATDAASQSIPVVIGSDYGTLNKAQRYALALVNPAQYGGRIPDEDSNQTAFFLSYQNYLYPVDMTPTGDQPGAFCFCVQPKIGNPTTPAGFKLAACDPFLLNDAALTTDWSSSTAYLKSIGGVNPRMTNEIDTLAYSEAGFAAFTGSGGLSTALPFGASAVPNAGNGFTNVVYDGTTGAFILPPGQFTVTMQVIGTGTPAGFTFGGSATTAPLTTASIAGTFNMQQTVIVTSGTGLSPDPGARFVPGVSGGTTVTGSQIIITPIAKTDSVQSLNSGMVEKVRPTCCCVLVTYMGTTLNDGGDITSAVVSGDALSSRFFSQVSNDNAGALRSFESVSNVPGAYNGPLKRGTYAWWKQDNALDRAYYNVSGHNAYMYPGIVVFGKFSPDTATSVQTQYPIRVSIVVGYQYTTTSQLPEKVKYKGSDVMVAAALNFLDDPEIKQCMANGDHQGFFERMKQLMSQVSSAVGTGIRKAKSVYDTVAKYAPAARNMIETLEPMLAF